MQSIQQFLMGVSEAWRRLSTSARVNLVAASLVTVLVVIGVTALQTRAQYVQLYGNLDLTESGEIQGFLSDQAIPFTLENGGRSILVPIENRSAARVGLAEKGLPTQQGKGWELFDQQSLLTNEYQQDVQYQRAIAGELMRQLNEFDFIKRSAAFIFFPKDALFAAEQEQAHAAVTLELRRPMSEEEVKGVLQLVSAYGGGKLSSKNITLMSTEGDSLHVPIEDGVAAVAGSKLDVIRKLERYGQEKIENILRKMNVPRFAVSVSADVDFTQEKMTYKEILEGLETVTSTTETSTTNRPANQGAPGMAANAPAGVVPGAQTATDETSTETTTNIEPSTRLTESVTEGGNVKQWTVSVAIATGKAQQGTGTDQEPVAEPVRMSEDEQKVYRTMVAKALPNLKPEDVDVFDLPINIDKIAPVAEAFKDVQSEITGFAVQENAIIILKVVLVILGIWAVMRAFKKALVPVEVVHNEKPLAVPTTPPEELRKRQIASEVERVSKDNPETVAALLRSWMSEAEE